MRMPLRVLLAVALGLTAASSPASAAGDAAAGEQVFRKMCAGCHSIDPGVHKTGPSLAGVYGRKAGSSGFPRANGLTGADFTWNAENLNEYLADPQAFVLAHTQNRRSAMPSRLKDPQQREDVIAYLKQQSGEKK